jgi:hypothetical protein
MDMIAFSGDDDLDVLLETAEVGRDLQTALAESAEAYTSLRVVKSLNPFGSDHVPFIRAGIPCVLTIENDWDEYSAYHTSRDTIENVRLDMGGEVLRMNAGALASLAGSADEPAPASVTVLTPNVKTTLFGGFVYTVQWAASGDVESFDLAYSADGGATFAPIATLVPGTARHLHWTVPPVLDSRRGRVRVTARVAGGGEAVDVSDADFRFLPAGGPTITSVRYRAKDGGQLVVRGRFSVYSQVFVDNDGLGSATAFARDIRGDTTVRLYAEDANLDAIVPPGRLVRVRVVDFRTGQASPDVVFQR